MSLFFQCIWIIFAITLFLLMWFKTNFVYEYGKALGLKKILKIDLFDKELAWDFEITYYKFITDNYDNFWIRLLSCSICFSVFLGLILMIINLIIFGNFIFILLMPLNIILGLLIYLKVKNSF